MDLTTYDISEKSDGYILFQKWIWKFKHKQENHICKLAMKVAVRDSVWKMLLERYHRCLVDCARDSYSFCCCL